MPVLPNSSRFRIALTMLSDSSASTCLAPAQRLDHFANGPFLVRGGQLREDGLATNKVGKLHACILPSPIHSQLGWGGS